MFSKAESKYSSIERELLAIKFGIVTFKPFVFVTKFIVHSDHKPLRYLQNMEECDFTVKYHPGPENEDILEN